MKLRDSMRKGTITLALIALMAGCGGNAGGSEVSGNPGNSNNPNSDQTSETPIEEDSPILDISTINNDLDLDDGAPVFDEEVSLKAWCIIGDPDKATYVDLVKAFNDEYAGSIHLDVTYIGHYDFYNSLDTTWQSDRESIPDILIMHNEKTAEYANKGYLYPLDDLLGAKTGVNIDFSNAYENIDRVTKYGNHRFAVPMDAHGFLTYFRQDIIKKNELGFDNNTRFIPQSRAEYQSLLEGLKNKAAAGTLWTRNINKGNDHSWKQTNSFLPEFNQSTDPDGLSALYANGGNMMSGDHKRVTFQENAGFQSYLTDIVDRYNSGLMGDSVGNVEGFGNGSLCMFSEGPWWASSTYTLSWNNKEMTTLGNGVTQEDIDDPVYSKPFAAAHPDGWWSLDDAPAATKDKWYGNGHAVSITRNVTSLKKVAAALTYTNWYVQGKDADTDKYNLATWCNSGHIPAWKNVYDSAEYKAYEAKNVTLQGLGDPADIMAMEGLPYETTVFNGVATAVSSTLEALKSSKGCTKEQAIQILNDTASSVQQTIDLMNFDF